MSTGGGCADKNKKGGALKSEFAVGRIAGASPAEHRYYVLVMFDISEAKKYRMLVRTLKKYGLPIQRSVFEAQLKPGQIKDLLGEVERLMSSERFYNPSDNVRVYKVAGNCDVTVFGQYVSTLTEENVFI